MTYDIIIAGAGPAGSTCARACAKAGLSVLMLERDSFPRPKPCGGAVSKRALDLLDLSLPEDLIERECFGVRIHLGARVTEIRREHRIAIVVSREKFDHYLADRAVEAGAILRQAEPVQTVSVLPDRVEIGTELGRYVARALVGADGANSVVGRTLRPLFPRDEISAALVGSFLSDDRVIDARLDGMLDLYFGVAPRGYGWVIPRKGCFQLGVLGNASEFDAPQKVFSEFAAARGMPVARPQGHTIPWGGISRRIIGPRMLLAGDAAGFADPFIGAGIGSAILSGKLAAQAVVDGIRGGKETLPRYAAECDRLIVREMRVALWMARMLKSHPKLFLTIFFSDQQALDTYLDIPAGRSDYRRFRSWLLLRLPGYIVKTLFGRNTVMM